VAIQERDGAYAERNMADAQRNAAIAERDAARKEAEEAKAGKIHTRIAMPDSLRMSWFDEMGRFQQATWNRPKL